MHRTFLAVVGVLAVGCDDHLFPTPCTNVQPATWQGVLSTMDSNCGQCHTGPNAPAGFGIVLVPDGQYNTLRYDINNGDVSALSQYDRQPAWTGELVIPGDSANSVLYQAIAWTGDVTDMPLGASQPLCDGAPEPTPVSVIRDWIDGGAEGLADAPTNTGMN